MLRRWTMEEKRCLAPQFCMLGSHDKLETLQLINLTTASTVDNMTMISEFVTDFKET